MAHVSMTVNGKVRKGDVEPRLLLVHFLREQLLLTGAHVGCDTSQCGACTVLIDGRSAKSCTIFAVQADGSDITTIEGLAKDGQLHPVQEGFWQEHGLQCGFCTPGMIMSAVNLLNETPQPTEQQIREGISATSAAAPATSTSSTPSSTRQTRVRTSPRARGSPWHSLLSCRSSSASA